MSTSSTNPSVEIVYPEPLELLNEFEHHDSITLTRKLNEIIEALNKLKK
jgi:hypothetical protein